MPIGNFDYKILQHLRLYGPRTMHELIRIFGTNARPSIESLCTEHLLFWDSSPEDPFSHSDSKSQISITPAGECALNNFTESERLTASEKWRERLWGVLSTLLAQAAACLIANAENIVEFLSQFL